MKNKYPWIRLWREALHDPKIVTLSDRHFRTWVGLLMIADDASGELPSMRDVSVHLRVTPPDAEQMVRELVDLELVDYEYCAGGPSAYVMHAWKERQMASDNSTERTRKYRARIKEKSSRERHGDVTVTVQTQTQKERIYNKPSYLDATRDEEAKIEKSNLIGVGVEAQRAVARGLNIGDPAPIVSAFLRWPKSRGAKNPDAMFEASAAKIYARLKPAQRAACQPFDDPEPEPLPPVQASSALRAKLAKGNRHGR